MWPVLPLRLFRRVMDVHGISESSPAVTDFNILWTGVHPKPFVLRGLHDYQRVNHFPRRVTSPLNVVYISV